ncbi:HNH endonuclease [Streptomyces sp. ME02-6979-3A]|uniref:HNH endonuclease n=1 Tax=Streptomyces sp. ME02-6979-3A TaxID=3028673 RepID=UPI0039F71444
MPGDRMRPTHILCAHCGNQSVIANTGPVPTYCSAACRRSASHSRMQQDGRYEEALARERQSTERRRAGSARPCPYCHAPMAHPRRKQCGSSECRRAFNAERMRDYQRQYKKQHGYYQTRLYDRPRVKAYPITCARCGREAVVTKTTALYCSHQCFYNSRYGADRPQERYAGITKSDRLAQQRKKTRRRRAQRALEQAAAGTKGAGVWSSGRCGRCGEHFTRHSTGEPTGYCSRRCRVRSAASLRRALQAGSQGRAVARWQIFERDRWTCHICGDPVDRSAQVPDLAAPTLDHVTPIARGGSHTEDNLKTAHFYCNSVKRDLVDGWSAVA